MKLAHWTYGETGPPHLDLMVLILLDLLVKLVYLELQVKLVQGKIGLPGPVGKTTSCSNWLVLLVCQEYKGILVKMYRVE